jgi:hypothetical protein
MVISVRNLLSNREWNPGGLEGSLAVIGLFFISWNSAARSSRTAAKWFSIAAVAVSVLLLAMVILLPGEVTMRLLFGTAALIILGIAIWNVSRN